MAVFSRVRGNLGQDFRLRPVTNPNTNEPSMVLNFSIASPNFKRNTEGKLEVTSTEWINCEYWNRNVEHLHRILQKGMPVLIEGEEYIETYTNRNGEEVKSRKLRVAEIFIVPTERVEGITLRPARDYSADNSANSSEDVNISDDIPL